MGNYNGSVRCSHCYARGHNKRSCPEYTDFLRNRLDSARERQKVAVANGDTHPSYQWQVDRYAKEIGKRTGIDPLTNEKITKRGPTRRCSYCKHKHGAHSTEGLGHTRRTCAELKRDYADAVKANATFRARILETLRQHGLGVGSLIRQHQSGYFADENGEMKWDRRPVTVIVRRIDWDAIAWCDPHASPIHVQRMDMLRDNQGHAVVDLPYQFNADGIHIARFTPSGGWDESYGPRVGGWDPAKPDQYRELLSRVPSETINPPAGWEHGDSAVLKKHYASLKG